jgi:hypothetical protein
MAFKISDKAKDVIKVIAPTLGAALGGPLGGLAGQILGGLVAGNDPKALEESLLTQKPETLIALRKAEQDFKVKLKELDIEEDKLVYQDRSNARELAKTDMGPHKVLSLVFIGGYFMILAAFFVGKIEINASVMQPFLILIGVLTANIPSIMQFWFGTSSGSQRKTDLLVEQANASKA